MYHPGWAITISLEPTFEVRDRCGLSTSTRKVIQNMVGEVAEDGSGDACPTGILL